MKHNKNQKKKRARRSNKRKISKILNIIYSNVRGIKSKTKSIQEILFETQCDIFAITDINLKNKEKVNINGYTWIGINRASEGGRYRIPNKQQHQNSCHNRPTRKHKH